VPPVYIPDDHDYCQSQSILALPPTLRFQKTLSRILTESILELERYALSKAIPHRAALLNPIISATSLSLAELEPECLTQIDRFYLTTAELQILSFHLLGPKNSYSPPILHKMFTLACAAIETLHSLATSQTLMDLPAATMKYLGLAAYTLLKFSRSDTSIRSTLDFTRGKAAYFAAINLFKKASVEPEDVCVRSAKILTQLWTSKRIFRGSGGSVDALSLRCGSRLAMSITYDCYWWWRSEFAGVPDPYTRENGKALREQEWVRGWLLTIHADSGEAEGESNMAEFAWLQEAFPEFAWPTSQDLISAERLRRSSTGHQQEAAQVGSLISPRSQWL
jgi:transcriptional regulatory protein LEU3